MGMTIKEIVELTGLSQAEFAKKYGIPKRTVESWLMGERKPPAYVISMLEKMVKYDFGK